MSGSNFVKSVEGLRMDGSYKEFGPSETEGEEGDDVKPLSEVDLSKYSSFDVAFDDIDLCPSPHVAGVAILRSATEEEPEEEVRVREEERKDA